MIKEYKIRLIETLKQHNMKKFHYLAAIISALAFTSCLSSGENAKDEATYNYGGTACFNYVIDLETEEANVFDGPNYKFHYDYTNGNIDIEVTNLKVAEDLAQTALRLPTLPFTVDAKAGFYITRDRNITPTNVVNNNYVFDEFDMRSNPLRTIYANGQIGTFPIYVINFTLNSRYAVTTFPVQSTYLGTSYSEEIGEQGTELFKNDSNLMAVIIDYKKLTAIVNVLHTKFGETMPDQAFVIKDLPVQLNEGGYIINPDADTTYPIYDQSNKLIENCSVSNVSAASTLSTGLTAINFNIDLTGLGTKAGYEYGKYKVRTSLNYYGNSSSNNSGSGQN